MEQLVYRDRFYLHGKLSEVMANLKKLALEFKTVKDFLEYQTKDM